LRKELNPSCTGLLDFLWPSAPKVKLFAQRSVNPGAWAPDEREAVKSFLRLAEEMAAFKSRNQPVTQGTIDELVAALRSLREQDRVSYERVQQGLRAD